MLILLFIAIFAEKSYTSHDCRNIYFYNLFLSLFYYRMPAGLDFEVVPESCLRNDQIQLMLGMPINQVIVALQNVSRIIKNVEFVYDNKVIYIII